MWPRAGLIGSVSDAQNRIGTFRIWLLQCTVNTIDEFEFMKVPEREARENGRGLWEEVDGKPKG